MIAQVWAKSIFSDVAYVVINEVRGNNVHPDSGPVILARLASSLTRAGWNTWRECLEEFERHGSEDLTKMVAEAFYEAGLLKPEDSE